MKILDIEQGSPSWLALRRDYITATDAATLLNINPYMSSNMLWEEKMGLRLPKEQNAAMIRGSKLESEALSKFNEINNFNMNPAVILSNKHEFAMASLDGLSECKNYILEIKCPGNKNFHKYKLMSTSNQIEPCHFAQVQHQMMCANVNMVYYFCYQTYDNFIVEVKRDDEFIEKMLIEEKKFFDCMMNFERPK